MVSGWACGHNLGKVLCLCFLEFRRKKLKQTTICPGTSWKQKESTQTQLLLNIEKLKLAIYQAWKWGGTAVLENCSYKQYWMEHSLAQEFWLSYFLCCKGFRPEEEASRREPNVWAAHTYSRWMEELASLKLVHCNLIHLAWEDDTLWYHQAPPLAFQSFGYISLGSPALQEPNIPASRCQEA